MQTDTPLIRATWRGMTRFCTACGGAHVSFTLEDGTVLRLLVDGPGLRMLKDSIADYQDSPLGRCPPCRTQSESASGKPQVEESSPSGSSNV